MCPCADLMVDAFCLQRCQVTPAIIEFNVTVHFCNCFIIQPDHLRTALLLLFLFLLFLLRKRSHGICQLMLHPPISIFRRFFFQKILPVKAR